MYEYLKPLLLYIGWMLASLQLIGQRTVGLVSIQPELIQEGYNLIYPHNQPNVYLLNNCGEVVHVWEDSIHFRPGNVAYILENGNLYKAKRPVQLESSAIGAGGAGGIIELRDWDNNLLWQMTLMDSLVRAHHDIAPLPNGNVLILSWERKSTTEIVLAGRDTFRYTGITELWPDFIIEVNPVLDSVVWEWHAWDHLVQEYDSTKQNFAKVSEHPERIHLNYDLREFGLKPDWMHTNAIDYHPELDQILLSIPNFNEIWIIDHSTTTEEARGHTGGKYGKGGDLLFRWGNPEAYQAGTEVDRQLFFQHDAQWIDDFLEGAHPYKNKIGLFNNRVKENQSNINIINPIWNRELGNYGFDGAFLPSHFEQTITHPEPSKMFSSGLSSVQVLSNGNLLVCVGRQGYSFEMTPDGQVVWEYITPLKRGIPIAQGEVVELNDNITFRIKRYPIDFPAFVGKELNPKGLIELDEKSLCEELAVSTEELAKEHAFILFPNPANQYLNIKFETSEERHIVLYNSIGQPVLGRKSNGTLTHLDLSMLANGIYLLAVNGRMHQKKICIMH